MLRDVTTINMAFIHSHCCSLAAPAWHPELQALPTWQAPLTSVSFRRPCRPSPLLQHLSHPPGAASIPLRGGGSWAQRPSRCNSIVVYLECYLSAGLKAIAILLLNLARDPWGWPEASGLPVSSLAIVQEGHGSIDCRSFAWSVGFQLPAVTADCQPQPETGSWFYSRLDKGMLDPILKLPWKHPLSVKGLFLWKISSW